MAKTRKKATKSKLPEFTPEQVQTLLAGLNQTWNEIGYDVLQSMQENEHRSYITRAEFLEVICDAGYCAGVNKEAGKLLDQLFDSVGPNIEMAYKYLAKFFPYARYS